jgi:hypothetical protein
MNPSVVLVWLCRVVAVALVIAGGSASGATINFDNLSDSTSVTNQYSGVTFSNAIVFSAGVSLNEIEFPPRSGTNVASDNGGPIGLIFSSPVPFFQGYFTYGQQVTVRAFDAANSLLGSVSTSAACVSNLALSGTPGCAPNEFLSLNLAGISSVTITGNQAGGSFVMDDVSFSQVPEPGYGILVSIVAGVLVLRRRRVA